MPRTVYIHSISTVGKAVKAYSASVSDESWKKDHQEAMACFDLEAMLNAGLNLFDTITWMDTAWRTAVLSGKIKHDQVVEEAITDLFKLWAVPCEHVEKRIRGFEKKGYKVEGADKFRRYRAEVEGILTSEEKFFDKGLLQKLEAEAHREGMAAGVATDFWTVKDLVRMTS